MKIVYVLASALLLSHLGAHAAAAQTIEAGLALNRPAAQLVRAEDPLGVLSKPARLNVQRVSLGAALAELVARAEVPLVFSPSLLAEPTVSCFCQTWTVGEVLDHLLDGTGYRSIEADGQILIERGPVPAPYREAPSRVSRTTLISRVVPARTSGIERIGFATLQTQQTGIVAGRVVETGSQRGIANAQVSIPARGIGALTDAGGRFRLPGVPAGPVTIRAEMIGYGASERQIAVRNGETATVNFTLSTQAISLNEIVVTGTPGGTQRKAIGNVVDRVDAGKVRTEVAPARDVVQLIGQQSPGVHGVADAGMVGTGAAIRIRGVSSMALGQQPLLYVDGVRVDNSTSAGPPLRMARQVSRFNDFNPEDIESIEIIKGPAAATLYGTEASRGVIQIITKRGAEGAPTLEVTVRQGTNWLPDPEGRTYTTYWYDAKAGVLRDSMNIFQRARENGEPAIFTNGQIQGYDASLRGGSKLMRYYFSAGWDDQVGIVDYNWHKALTTRANLSITPRETWDINANLGFTRSHTRFATADINMTIWSAVMWTRPDGCDAKFRCFRYAPPEVIAQVDARSLYGRFTGSVQMNHRPTPWLTQRVTVGMDQGDENSSQLFPRVPEGETNYLGARGVGQKLIEYTRTLYKSLDWGATATFKVRDDLESATSLGFQYNDRETQKLEALGIEFPTPSVTTIGGAAKTTSAETWLQNKTLGTYVQEQLSWRDRVFVTGAVRGDDNSAFGADFEAALYPKLSATWVLSDEEFYPFAWLKPLRLRTAWGKAGMQPGAFDAVTLFTPQTGPGGTAVFTPRALGNTGLKPEVGEELEVGFDASLWEERLSLQFTYYNKKTRDAIVARDVRPSAGFPGTQMVNIGQVNNWGTEISTNTRVLNREPLGVDLGVNFSTQRNQIVDLGGLQTPKRDGNRNHVGYPVDGFYARAAIRGEFVPGTKTPTRMICYGGTGEYGLDIGGDEVPCETAPALFWGQAEPTWLGSVNLALRLGQNTRLSAITEFKGGHASLDMALGGTRAMTNTPIVNPITDPRVPWYLNTGNNNVPGYFKAGFARLREVSMAYTLPEKWVSRAGASRASITLAGRNLAFVWREQMYTWDGPGMGNGKESGGSLIFDPEGSVGAGDVTTVTQGHRIPPVAQLLTTLRVTF